MHVWRDKHGRSTLLTTTRRLCVKLTFHLSIHWGFSSPNQLAGGCYRTSYVGRVLLEGRTPSLPYQTKKASMSRRRVNDVLFLRRPTWRQSCWLGCWISCPLGWPLELWMWVRAAKQLSRKCIWGHVWDEDWHSRHKTRTTSGRAFLLGEREGGGGKEGGGGLSWSLSLRWSVLISQLVSVLISQAGLSWSLKNSY